MSKLKKIMDDFYILRSKSRNKKKKKQERFIDCFYWR